MVFSLPLEEVMKVGDLVKIDMYGDELCLITEISKHPGWKEKQVTLYFFRGAQRRWSVAIHHVALFNECCTCKLDTKMI